MILDTPQVVRRKQISVILLKTLQERAMMGADMTDAVYSIVKNSITGKNPGISKGKLIAKIFQRYYRHDFSPSELETIMLEIENAHPSSI